MGVKKPKQTPPAMIRDYWPRYREKAIIATIAMEIAVTIVISLALMYSVGFSLTDPAFIIMIIATLTATVGLNILLFLQLSLPFKDLTSALTHVSGEPSIVTPPNPNARHFERDGFKPLLQLIYELSADTSGTRKKLSPTTKDLSVALDNTAIGFIVLDSNARITYANHNAPVHTNMQNEAILDLLFEKDDSLQSWIEDCEQHAVHAERVWERIANKPIGQEGRKIYDVVASYQKGSKAEVVLSLFDRTELYQPEDDQLDFIAFAAHELRGPITVIRGYLDVLSDEIEDNLEPDQIELLSRLVVSANRLSSYINNILNASRYDRRHLAVRLAETKLAGIYDTIKDDMELRASTQNRLLSVAIPEGLPTVAADRASVSEVLSNLIDNAIKYSHEGGTVDVVARADGNVVRVSIIDRGIGMPGNVVNNLFHKFYRSHRSRETVAGTGIGLYISKGIIESHGGTMEVRSVEGEGSIFSFTLPIYSTVADKLQAAGGSNEGLISQDAGGWIKNHAMFRG